jgi:hypothetical protein
MGRQSLTAVKSIELSLTVAEVEMLRMWLPSQIDDLARASWVGKPWEIWRPQLDAARSVLQKIS